MFNGEPVEGFRHGVYQWLVLIDLRFRSGADSRMSGIGVLPSTTRACRGNVRLDA